MSKTKELLQYRGYDFLYDENDYKLFINKDTQEKIIVFNCKTNLNIVLLKLYLNIIDEINYKHAIVIVSKKVTPSSNKILDTVKKIYEIELFTEDEMSIDYTQYKYYYPHIKILDKEKEKLIKQYGNRLPIILQKDIIIRYLNYKKGDIIKIIRDNDYITYKLVK